MENKFTNRYYSFCKSLENLKKSVAADPAADFVLEGTAMNFGLTFDLSWKVMKDILVKQLGVRVYATGSPRENLQAAFSNGLIEDDVWIQMLKVRNQLAHDYDHSLAEQTFEEIVGEYYGMFCKFRDKAAEYYKVDSMEEMNAFRRE